MDLPFFLLQIYILQISFIRSLDPATGRAGGQRSPLTPPLLYLVPGRGQSDNGLSLSGFPH